MPPKAWLAFVWWSCYKAFILFIYFFKVFLMWTIFKVFIEFVTILLLFHVLVFWPRGMWDLSSPTRDQTHTPCIGRRSLNHWTAREVPCYKAFKGRLLSGVIWCVSGSRKAWFWWRVGGGVFIFHSSVIFGIFKQRKKAA